MTTIVKNVIDSLELLSPTQIKIIKELRQDNALTRKEFVDRLNTPRTTIFDNLLKLQKRRIVEKFIKNNGTHGRPHTYWRLKSNFKIFIFMLGFLSDFNNLNSFLI